MAREQGIQAQEIGGGQQKASRMTPAHRFVGTATGKLEGFEEQISPVSTVSSVRDMFVLQTVTWKNETTKSC